MSFSFGGSWEHSCDVWKTTPPEPAESKFKCDKCGEEFYPDDPVYECDCENLCKDCALEWLNDKWHYATWEQCYGDD